MSSVWNRAQLLFSGIAAGILLVGCSESSELATQVPAPGEVQHARGGATSGPTVSAANPRYGSRGETGKLVTITGSGFLPGSTVAWERGGIPDPAITVHTAVVVSATRIDAEISIAVDADLSFYDIAVTTPDRKKGVGTEMFEVTNAISIGTLAGGNTTANAASDNVVGARVVGHSYVSNSQRAFYWPGPDGNMVDLGPGTAMGISQDGLTIAGISSGRAVVWTRVGTMWSSLNLPISTRATGSRVEFLVSNAAGQGFIVSGSETFKTAKGNGTTHLPRLWRYDGVSWALDTLDSPPLSSNGAGAIAIAVNSSGQAVGSGGFWDVDGSWTRLPGPGDDGTRALSEDATLIAGFTQPASGSESVAAYWSRIRNADGSYGPWTGPHILPGACARAMGIDQNKRIAGHRCANTANQYVSAVWKPPYDLTSMTTLRGLGDRANGGSVWATSPRGTILAGVAANVGAIWDGGSF